MLTRAIVSVALLSALHVSGAAARELFVNNVEGDNRADGTRPQLNAALQGPVRSLTKALKLAGPGDRIVLANTGVPYHESVTLTAWQHRSDGVRPFELDGQGATLDGSAPVPLEAWELYRDSVFRFRPYHLHHHQLFHQGKPLLRRPADASAPEPPELQPLEWCLWRGHAYFRAESQRDVAAYDLYLARLDVGITIYETAGVVVHDLIVQGFRLDGINVKDDVRDVLVAGVICRGNGRSGIAVEGASRARVVDSLLGDNAEAQLLATGAARVRLGACQLIDRAAPAITGSAAHRVQNESSSGSVD